MALLLVLTMIGHVAGASAHASVCQESQDAGHHHHDGGSSADHHHGEADGAVAQAAHDHDTRDQEEPGAATAPCHGTATGCHGCSVNTMTDLTPPEMIRQPVAVRGGAFSPTDLGVEHRPPIAIL